MKHIFAVCNPNTVASGDKSHVIIQKLLYLKATKIEIMQDILHTTVELKGVCSITY